jgi:hypothetical protein
MLLSLQVYIEVLRREKQIPVCKEVYLFILNRRKIDHSNEKRIERDRSKKWSCGSTYAFFQIYQ